MPKITTAYAKNIIRRSFRELVDPTPDAVTIEQLWQHFDSQCAYCGVDLVRGAKAGHVDHLVCAAQRGPNHISNRVLACARCNEVEKRDSDWQEFLRTKCPDESAYNLRRARIVDWCDKHRPSHQNDPELLKRAESLADEIVRCFDAKIAELRAELHA